MHAMYSGGVPRSVIDRLPMGRTQWTRLWVSLRSPKLDR
jgi:hypothetical protein